MALMKCPECGGQLSERAEVCPHCGLQRKYFQDVIDEKKNDLILVCDAKEIREAIGDFLPEYIELMFEDEYVPCRKVSQVFSKYKNVYQAVQRVKRVDELAAQLQMHKEQVQYFMDHMEHLSEEVDRHNDWYLEQSLRVSEGYLDHILSDVDPKIQLDEEQRKVVLTEDDYALVVAGAGAGKTTTMAAKVKYLVEKKGVKPEEIIVISFTNKAVKELSQRINKQLQIPAKVMTFHAFGNAIIREHAETIPELERYKRKYFLDILKERILNLNYS